MAHILFQWAPASSISVSRVGHTFLAEDLDSSNDLLFNLGLTPPTGDEKKTQKQKPDLPLAHKNGVKSLSGIFEEFFYAN